MDDTAFATVNSYGGVDYAVHNKGIKPVFMTTTIVNKAASELAGRAVYDDAEVVLIYVAGDNLTAASHPVDESVIARFPEEYARWRGKQTAKISGTPLADWPPATPRFIKEMEFLHVMSVEDLSAISDGNLENFPEGRMWREKARAWLASASDTGAIIKYAAEATRLKEDIAEMRAQLALLQKNKVPGKYTWSEERRKAASDSAKRRWNKGTLGEIV